MRMQNLQFKTFQCILSIVIMHSTFAGLAEVYNQFHEELDGELDGEMFKPGTKQIEKRNLCHEKRLAEV